MRAMRWVLLSAVLALATAACGSGTGSDQSTATIPAHEHLVALGTPWKDGFPIYGVHVATLSRTGTLIGWDTGRDRLNWDSMALAPDGDHVAQVVNGTLFVYDSKTATVRALGHVGAPSLDPEWLPDGRQLSVIQWTGTRKQPGRRLLILDAQTGAIQRRMPLPDWTGRIAYSRDGSRAAVSTFQLTSAQSSIGVLDMRTARATSILTVHHDLVDGLAWSPDGRHLAYTTFSRGLRMIDADGHHNRSVWRPPFGFIDVSAGSFAPDNHTLAVSWQADFNGADAPAASRGYLIDTNTGRATRMHAGPSGIDGPFAWVAAS